MTDTPAKTFADLALSPAVLSALTDVGYESPSPIQAATIPVLLSGADLVGQAQTGTGKTAAFALPVLSRLDLKATDPQVLVLVPTRELALQVAEAFQRYAAHIKGFHVLPIYGGQSYQPQLSALRRGVHVVVGTPGRVTDHLSRGTLKLTGLTTLILDEADEMLRMGFIDAVESILEQTPPKRQVALFSATMPGPIRRIAQKHLRDPQEVTIKSKTTTATNIRQRYWMVSGMHKLDALTRILEAETFDAMLIFTRTKQSTVELAEKLEARGFAATALNGDIQQRERERTVARLKAGQIDIVVATDVAARGLDVERISHVVNFDVPYGPESYVHRIGRTGRAGRSGEAILFIAPRERNMLRVIERTTRQVIEPMNLPSIDAVNQQRVGKFKQKLQEAMERGEGASYRPLVEQLERELEAPLVDIAATLLSMAQGKAPLLLQGRDEPAAPRALMESSRPEHAPPRERFQRDRPERARSEHARPEHADARRDAPRSDESRRDAAPHDGGARHQPARERADFTPPSHEARDRDSPAAADRFEHAAADSRPRSPADVEERPRRAPGMETFRLEVGLVHGVKPGNIVGAIANEAGLDGAHIGRVDIREDHTLVDLPEGMPKQIFKDLQKVKVVGRELQISRTSPKKPKRRS
jgi:ATP-dependent RNA helicase DeaD